MQRLLARFGHSVRVIVIVGVFGGVFVPSGSVHAQSSPNCLDRMILVGEAAAVAETQRLLARGLLAKLPADACNDVWLRIARTQDNRWSFVLRKQDQAIEHTVKDFETIASWVESWLLSGTNGSSAPDQSSSAAPPIKTATAPPALSGGAVASTPEPPQTATKPTVAPVNAIPVQVALRSVTDIDSLGPLSLGAGLALRIDVSHHAWCGMAASATWAPEHDATHRRALRFVGRAGWLHPLGWGAFQLGAGVGIIAGDVSQQTADTVVRDEESGPIIELVTAFDVFLSSQWSLSFAVVGRAYLSDEFFSGSQPPTPGEPDPLSTFSLSFEIGIAWDFARPS